MKSTDFVPHNIKHLDQCKQYIVEGGLEDREGPITHCNIETGKHYIQDDYFGSCSFFWEDCTIEEI